MQKVKIIDADLIKEAIADDYIFVKKSLIDSLKLYGQSDRVHQPRKVKVMRNQTASVGDRIFALPVYISGNDSIAGVKWISRYPRTDQTQKNTVHSLVVLNETETNAPIAIMDGYLLSAMRTFAVTLINLDLFLNTPKTVACLGMGELGRMHCKILPKLYPSIKKIKCYSKHAKFDDLLSNICHKATSYQEAIDDADVIVTLTQQRSSYIRPQDISNKTKLIINISLFDLTQDVFSMANNVIIDDWETCTDSIIPLSDAYRNNLVYKDKIHAISDILLGYDQIKVNDTGFNIVNTQGMAVETVYLAHQILKKLNHKNLPTFTIE